MELLKASRNGDLEKVEAIYQSEAISPDTVAKGAVIACRFGHLHVLKYLVSLNNGTILRGYVDTAAKYEQHEISMWLKEAIKTKSNALKEKNETARLQKAIDDDWNDPENAITPMRPQSFIPKKVKR